MRKFEKRIFKKQLTAKKISSREKKEILSQREDNKKTLLESIRTTNQEVSYSNIIYNKMDKINTFVDYVHHKKFESVAPFSEFIKKFYREVDVNFSACRGYPKKLSGSAYDHLFKAFSMMEEEIDSLIRVIDG